MQLDIEHVLFWMDAIRNSENKERTLDSFWKGQIRSKVWLCEELRKHVNQLVSIDIHGGWNGVLASMLFQSGIPVLNIRSVDIDSACEKIATDVNKLEEMSGKFRAVTADMCTIRSDADVIINTSCEHITQDQFDLWKTGMPANSLLVLQSNNYDIPEHVRTAASLEEFKTQCDIDNILWAGQLELPLYTRWMIIGRT